MLFLQYYICLHCIVLSNAMFFIFLESFNCEETCCVTQLDQLWTQDIWLHTSLYWWSVSLSHTHTHIFRLCPVVPLLILPCVRQVTFCLQWHLMITVSSGSATMRIRIIWSSVLTLERFVRQVSTLWLLLCRCVKFMHLIFCCSSIFRQVENGPPQGNMGNTPVRYQISFRKWMRHLCFIMLQGNAHTPLHVMTTYLNDEELFLDSACVDSQAAACVLILVMAQGGKSLEVICLLNHDL